MVCVVPIGKVAQSSRKERMIRGVIHRKSKTIEEMVRADRPLSEEKKQAMQLVQLAPTAKKHPEAGLYLCRGQNLCGSSGR